MTAAWHGAAFGRMKKMPDLADILGEKRAKPEQTPDQMLAVMQSMKSRQGYSFRER